MKYLFYHTTPGKYIIALIFSLAFTGFSFAQSKTVSEQITDGIHLHDKGDYAGAIALYKKVLKQNSRNSQANYEIASSYFAMKDYENTIKHSNAVIAANGDYVDQAYILKGSTQDLQAKPEEAVKTYKAGISKFPKNYLLYYNLALTSFNLKEFKDTDEALMKGLRVNPAHASSHLLLGYSMNLQGNRVKSILALSNFLLLEPASARSAQGIAMLEENFKNEKSNTIKIKSAPGSKTDEFSTAELMLALLESSNSSELNKNKSTYELFAGNMKSLFTILGELKDKNKGFWWDFYVDFFYSLANENHSDAFSYYITQSKKDNVILKWLDDNKDKYKEMSDWYTAFKR